MARIYAARQRQTDGRWDMAVRSDEEGWCHPIGYCTAHPVMPADGPFLADAEMRQYVSRMAPFADRFHADGHATAEEAQACYWQYELDHQLRFPDDQPDARTQHRCDAPGCDQWTSALVECGAFHRWRLCAAHRTRETVEALLAARADKLATSAPPWGTTRFYRPAPTSEARDGD